MSKAFTKESDQDDFELEPPPAAPAGVKNYMTREGFTALQAELNHLLREERPKVVETVSWAAGNGDRSENGDYIYGKRRLREIDRLVRYLNQRLKTAIVVDSEQQKNLQQVFFGATVTYAHEDGTTRTVKLVGIDEADLSQGKISWISPVASALLKAKVGDTVELRTPTGVEGIEVVAIYY
jgi:transcription elongation factor GreB